MKQLMLCLLLSITSQTVFGQVTGKLTDQNNQAVPFATAALLKAVDSTVVKSALTNDKGIFQITDLTGGKYLIRISVVGYQTYDSESFELSADSEKKDLGPIILRSTSKQLDGVVIRADKPQVQQTAEGVTVNVQN